MSRLRCPARMAVLWLVCLLGLIVGADSEARRLFARRFRPDVPPDAPDTPAVEVGAVSVRRGVRLGVPLRRLRKRSVVLPSVDDSGSEGNSHKARKKRVLMLISDTGGGHRASAEAVEAMMEQLRPGEIDVRIVDVYTEYCPFPFNTFVDSYQGLAKLPFAWKLTWHASALPPVEAFLNGAQNTWCKRKVSQMFREQDPDLIVSLHPLTQSLSFSALDSMARKDPAWRSVPYATVVTDLGSAHPAWFDKKVDRCFIPNSDAVRKVAVRRRLTPGQIRQHGLPVRPSFWQEAKSREALCSELGLDASKKTVLVVGGGDGVGSLRAIVKATANELSKEVSALDDRSAARSRPTSTFVRICPTLAPPSPVLACTRHLALLASSPRPVHWPHPPGPRRCPAQPRWWPSAARTPSCAVSSRLRIGRTLGSRSEALLSK